MQMLIPRRPPSAMALFLETTKGELLRDDPDNSEDAILHIASNMWEALEPDAKEVCLTLFSLLFPFCDCDFRFSENYDFSHPFARTFLYRHTGSKRMLTIRELLSSQVGSVRYFMMEGPSSISY